MRANRGRDRALDTRPGSGRSTLLALGLSSALLACGSTCPPQTVPAPMTERRAHQIDPAVVTGLAVSATHVFGDCRAIEPPRSTAATCAVATNMACARARAPVRLLAVPVNMSIPLSPECEGRFSVSDLIPRALADRRASKDGELVIALPPGRYTIYLSLDDRCAACGLEAQRAACLVEVLLGQVATHDLVLDQSMH